MLTRQTATDGHPTSAQRQALRAHVAYIAHMGSGALAGICCGILVGTALATLIILWNELVHIPSAAVLVLAYLATAYGALFAVLGAMIGTGTALLERLTAIRWHPRSVTALQVAALWAVAGFVYAARKSTYGLYYSDHAGIDSYAQMLILYSGIVVAVGVLAIGSAIGLFFALRTLLEHWSRATVLAATGAVWLSAVAGVFVGHILVRAQAPHVSESGAAAQPPPLQVVRSNGQRVILIGLDGATWDVLRPLMDEGRVPWLGHLAAHGATGPLATLSPTVSPMLWTTIATGMEPEKHGIFTFAGMLAPGIDLPMQRLPEFVGLAETLPRAFPDLVRHELVSSTGRRRPALWNMVSELGGVVAAINWYVSHPTERIRGAMVSDRTYEFLTEPASSGGTLPEHGHTYPAALIGRIAKLLPREADLTAETLLRFMRADTAELALVRNASPDEPLGALRFHCLADTFYAGIAATLRNELRPDLLMLYLKGIDRIEHHFWQWKEPRYFRDVSARDAERLGNVIDNYYVFTDQLLSSAIGTPDSRTFVFVVSDHGHGAAFNTEGVSGNHSNAPDGIFIAYGPGIRAGATVQDAALVDIAPTVLAAMGYPTAQDMDGVVLGEIFEPSFVESSTVPPIATYGLRQAAAGPTAATPEDEAIKQQLRSLGYL